LRFVERHLDEDDRLLVEPWLPRERDWCVTFDAPFDRRRLGVHEAICTADGAWVGSLFAPRTDLAEPWRERLAAVAERVAGELDRQGYFGPVCMDAFSWRDGARSRLRPLVDLNCRQSASAAAQRLWGRIAPERALFYRSFQRRKLGLPVELSDSLSALGPERYDPDERRGILLASPSRLGGAGDRWRPGKLALLFVADGRSECLELERRFRERFEV
jgi:hypothetical protein